MGNGVGLIANEVIESVVASDVNEAVSNPSSRLDDLADFGHHFERIFHAFVAQLAAVFQELDVSLSTEAQHVEGVFGCDGYEIASARPEDLSRHDELLLPSNASRLT